MLESGTYRYLDVRFARARGPVLRPLYSCHTVGIRPYRTHSHAPSRAVHLLHASTFRLTQP